MESLELRMWKKSRNKTRRGEEGLESSPARAFAQFSYHCPAIRLFDAFTMALSTEELWG